MQEQDIRFQIKFLISTYVYQSLLNSQISASCFHSDVILHALTGGGDSDLFCSDVMMDASLLDDDIVCGHNPNR